MFVSLLEHLRGFLVWLYSEKEIILGIASLIVFLLTANQKYPWVLDGIKKGLSKIKSFFDGIFSKIKKK